MPAFVYGLGRANAKASSSLIYKFPYWVKLYYSTRYLYKDSTNRAGQAGGGSFKRDKNYKPKKIAYRMCTGRPTSAMPKLRFLCAPVFGRSVWWSRFCGGWLCFCGVSVVVMQKITWCGVVSEEWWDVGMWCSDKWWDEVPATKSATPYYKALPRTTKYNFVLQNITPYYTVLFPTTKYFLRTAKYSVLQNITTHHKVLFRTTKYDSGLQSTTPDYKVLPRTTEYYKVLVRDTGNVQYIARSNLWDAKHNGLRHSWLIVVTHETSSTMRGATGVTFQHPQILRLPRKSGSPTSWNVAPAMNSHTSKCDTNHMKRHFQWRTIPARFENDPNISDHEILIPAVRNAYFSPSAMPYAFCMEKLIISCAGYLRKL